MENKEENANQPPAEKKEKNRNTLFIIIIFLLLAGCGVLGWLYWEQTRKIETVVNERSQLASEKKAVEAELQDLQEEFEDLETNNEEMQARIVEQQEKVQELLKEAEKHKDDAYIIYKLKKEAKTLREIMKGFVHTIDSLNTLNKQLEAEKVEMKRELKTQQKKYTDLEEVKETLADKVKIGSRLKTLDLMAVAQRVKRNNVHRETNRAGRAEKVKVCFTLEKNEITEPGKKNIYVRIVSPSGKVLTPDLTENEEFMFEFNGVEGYYSIHKEIIYENQELDICTYYDVVKELPEGEFLVEVYSDGADIGKTSFELK